MSGPLGHAVGPGLSAGDLLLEEQEPTWMGRQGTVEEELFCEGKAGGWLCT